MVVLYLYLINFKLLLVLHLKGNFDRLGVYSYSRVFF